MIMVPLRTASRLKLNLYIRELKYEPEAMIVMFQVRTNMGASTTHEGITAKSSWPRYLPPFSKCDWQIARLVFGVT